MKLNSQQSQSIMRYLLGELSEEEKSRLEEQYFADPDLFQEIRATRSDLIDAYLRGELSPHEHERFEKYFLALPNGRESLEFARALIKTVDHKPQSAIKQTNVPRQNWFQLPQLSFTKVIVAFAVLAIIFLGVWLVIKNSRRIEEAKQTPPSTQTNQPDVIQTPTSSPSETPKPELADVPPATPTRAIKVATFTLTPGTLRDSRAKVLLIPRNLNQVELKLEVEGGPYQNYQAELRTAEGDRRWSGTKIKPANDDVPQTVVVKIPAALFENADYVLRLSGVAGKDEVLQLGSYYFRVDRK